MSASDVSGLFRDLHLAGLTRIPRGRLAQVEAMLEHTGNGLDVAPLRARIRRMVAYTEDERTTFDAVFDAWLVDFAVGAGGASPLPAPGSPLPVPSLPPAGAVAPPSPQAESPPETRSPPDSAPAPEEPVAVEPPRRRGWWWRVAIGVPIVCASAMAIVLLRAPTASPPAIEPSAPEQPPPLAPPTPPEPDASPEGPPNTRGAPAADRREAEPRSGAGASGALPQTPGAPEDEPTALPVEPERGSNTSDSPAPDAESSAPPAAERSGIAGVVSAHRVRREDGGFPTFGWESMTFGQLAGLAPAVLLLGVLLRHATTGGGARAWQPSLRGTLAAAIAATLAVTGGALASRFVTEGSIQIPRLSTGVLLLTSFGLLNAMEWLWRTRDLDVDVRPSAPWRRWAPVALVLFLLASYGAWLAWVPRLPPPASFDHAARIVDAPSGSPDDWFVMRPAPLLTFQERPFHQTWLVLSLGMAGWAAGAFLYGRYYLRRRVPSVGARASTPVRTARRDERLGVPSPAVLPPRAVQHAASTLAAAGVEMNITLDIDATVRATARAGGQLDLRFRHTSPPLEVWFWLDQAIEDPLLGRLIGQVTHALRRAAVPVRVATFHRVPEMLRWEDGHRFRNIQAEAAARSARLFVATDGRELTFARHDWQLHKDWRLLRAWSDVTVIDFGFGLGRRMAEAAGLPVISPDGLALALGASFPRTGPPEADLPDGDILRLPPAERRCLAVLALCERPVVETTAAEVLGRLGVRLTPWEWRRLVAMQGGEPIALTLSQRAVLVNTHLPPERLAETVSAWQACEAALRSPTDGGVVEPWDKMELAWLGLWTDQPDAAIERLFRLRRHDEVARELRVRFEHLRPAEVSESRANREAVLRLPWRWADRSDRTARMLERLGWGGDWAPPRHMSTSLWAGGGLCLGLGLFLGLAGAWRTFGPAEVEAADTDGIGAIATGGLFEATVRVSTPDGLRLTATAPAGTQAVIGTGSVSLPVGCVRRLPGAVMRHCGQLPGGVLVRDDAVNHQRAVILHDGPEAEALADELIERGSVEAVLVGRGALDLLDHVTTGLSRDDALLVIAPPGTPAARLDVPSAWVEGRATDLGAFADALAFDGLSTVAGRWGERAASVTGAEFRLVGCADKRWKRGDGTELRRFCGAPPGTGLPTTAWWAGPIADQDGCRATEPEFAAWMRGTRGGSGIVTIDDIGTVRVRTTDWEDAFGSGPFTAADVDDSSRRVILIDTAGNVILYVGWPMRQRFRLRRATPGTLASGVAISAGGYRAYVGTTDGYVEMYDLRTAYPALAASEAVDGGAVVALAPSDDGRWLVAVSEGGVVRVHDGSTLEPRGTLAAVAGRCGTPAVAFEPNGDAFVLASACGSAEVWDLSGERSPNAPAVELDLDGETPITEPAWSPTGAALAALCGDALCAWDAASGALIAGPGGRGIADFAWSRERLYTRSAASVVDEQGRWTSAYARAPLSPDEARAVAEGVRGNLDAYCALHLR